MVGNGKVIRQTGSEIALDRQCCWVDADAFEDRVDHASNGSEGFGEAIKIYRGAFLAQEEGTPWAVSARERLRAKFIHAVGKLGLFLETNGRYETAIELYARGIDADNLVESFYQGLMRCYENLDRRSEAASAYRRLRQTLSVTLGIQPSTESQRLFETLRLN